jgi:ABC-type branched-subunit amino acid transport system substrate-binding protein
LVVCNCNAFARFSRSATVSVCRYAAVVSLFFLGVAFGLYPRPTVAAPAKAQALQNPPAKIAILLTTRTDQCFDSGDVAAIKYMTREAQERVNLAYGIGGRRLALEFYDDQYDAKKAVANVRAAVADKQTVAMIGLGNTARAKEVFDTAGQEITASGMPWLSNISVNSLFENFPTVFTMRGAQEDDSIPVMARFVRDRQATRLAFVGIKDQLFSAALFDGLKERLGPQAFVADYRFTLKDDKIVEPDIAGMIDALKQAGPDLIFLNIGGNRIPPVLAELEKAGINPPMMVSGRLETIFASADVKYSGDVYQLAWDGLPDAYNDRLRQRLFRSNTAELMFEGARNAKAPGWANGQCKERENQAEPSVLASANLRAIGVGLQYADMIGLIAEALKSSAPSTDAATLRRRVISGFKDTYAAGRGAYPGELENWSFRPGSRAAARTPFILMRPKGLGGEQLAPVQYVSLRNDALRQISTLYMDIDLTRAFRVDDKEKSFVAEFYLAMHAQKDQGVEQIDFANAFLDPQTNSKQITVRPLHQGGPSDAYPSDMKLYAVSGKFMYTPNFGNYPFDTQRFSIDIRSKSGDTPFIIQPSPRDLRDQTVDAEGWHVRDQYVGYDEDFLPVIDAKSHERSVVPFYKGSFVWVMKREATDYYLTVVIPLAFIMIIAYLAIFIPGAHFEAIVTIQVTALLSAVALYLTIPKVDSDQATISDKIFLFNYMLTALMIGISILRVNRGVDKVRWLDKGLGALHVVLIPVMVLLMALYVLGSSQSDGQTASGIWAAVTRAIWG